MEYTLRKWVYEHAVSFYVVELTDKKVKEINDYITNFNSDFIPLTAKDIFELYDELGHPRANEEIKFGWSTEYIHTIALESVIQDLLDDMLYSDGYCDTEYNDCYDSKSGWEIRDDEGNITETYI